MILDDAGPAAGPATAPRWWSRSAGPHLLAAAGRRRALVAQGGSRRHRRAGPTTSGTTTRLCGTAGAPAAAELLERLAVPADPGRRRGRAPRWRCRSWSAGRTSRASPPSCSRRARVPAAAGRQRRAHARLPRAGHRGRARGQAAGELGGRDERDRPAAHRPDRPDRARGAVRRRAARHARRPTAGGRPRRAASSGTLAETAAHAGNYLVTSIDAKVQAVAEKAADGGDHAGPRAGDVNKGSATNYKADSGAVVVMDVKTGRHRRDGQLPDVRPEHLGRRHQRQGLQVDQQQEGRLPEPVARVPG